MKRILLSGAILAAVGAFLFLSLGASSGGGSPTYKIELDNAFGLVSGADFKVAGVRAGTIKSIDLDQRSLHAVVTVQLTEKGFGPFRSDAFCQSRPQSLIGEYFVECQPGAHGRVLKPGSTIPVSHTESTIPADLLQDVMRMPYRERFTLIINELGAAVAGRSGDLQAALHRAVPALTETDNLLNLLANDSSTLQQLTRNSDSVITALANNSTTVQRFIDQANSIATDTATQDRNLRGTFQKLPGFLEQLRPALQKLSATTDADTPVLRNLNTGADQLDRLLTDLPGFSRSAIPAVKSLGRASVTGRQAALAAGPTIADLNRFAKPTPELAQNLAIVGHDLDDRSRAVEPDPRSPSGKGFTGLEALLQYVFNQTLAINTFGPFGHQLAVDAFVSPMCSPYATPATIAMNLKTWGPSYRKCYSWTGPSQPGVNETDPSNPSACVPDPAGAPPGHQGPATTACRLAAADAVASKSSRKRTTASRRRSSPAPAGGGGSSAASSSTSPPSTGGSTPSGSGASSGGGSSGGAVTLPGTIGRIVGTVSGATHRRPPTSSPANSRGGVAGQTQALLSYLLAP